MRKVATAVFVLILSGLGTMADMHFLLFLRTWEHYSSLTPHCSRDGIFIEAPRG